MPFQSATDMQNTTTVMTCAYGKNKSKTCSKHWKFPVEQLQQVNCYHTTKPYWETMYHLYNQSQPPVKCPGHRGQYKHACSCQAVEIVAFKLKWDVYTETIVSWNKVPQKQSSCFTASGKKNAVKICPSSDTVFTDMAGSYFISGGDLKGWEWGMLFLH